MDSRYTPPPLETLQKFIASLKTTTHSQRSDIIHFLESIVIKKEERNTHKILIGALIFALEKISLEYALLSPTRSKLYNELNDALNNHSKNILSDKQKLIYLHYFYQYAKENNIVLNNRESKEMNSQEADMKPIVDHITARISDELNALLVKRPAYSTLQENLESLPDKYQKICQTRKKVFLSYIPIVSSYVETNPQHVLLADFLKIIADMSWVTLKEVKEDKSKEHQKYILKYGAVLYIMTQIENEYSGYTRYTPENSALYRLCQDTLNISHTQDVPAIERLFYLLDLKKFIEEAKSEPTILAILKKNGISNIPVFLNTISQNITTTLTTEPFLWSCAKSLVSYVSLYLAGAAILDLATKGYYVLGIGKGSVEYLGSVVGAQIFGSLGKYLGSYWGASAEPELVVTGLASSLWWTFNKLKTLVLLDPIARFKDIESSKKFYAEINREVKNDLDCKICNEAAVKLQEEFAWFKALIQLPSKSVSKNIGERVEKLILKPIEALAAEPLPESKEPILEKKLRL